MRQLFRAVHGSVKRMACARPRSCTSPRKMITPPCAPAHRPAIEDRRQGAGENGDPVGRVVVEYEYARPDQESGTGEQRAEIPVEPVAIRRQLVAVTEAVDETRDAEDCAQRDEAAGH